MQNDFGSLVDSMAPKEPPVPETAQGLEASDNDVNPSNSTPLATPAASPAPVTPPPPAIQPPDSGGKFDSIVEQVTNDRLTQAQAANAAMQGTDADKTAKAMELGKQFNLPASAVLPNLDEYAARAQMMKNNKVLEENPSMAAWVAADPQTASTGADEFDKLNFIQKTCVTLANIWNPPSLTERSQNLTGLELMGERALGSDTTATLQERADLQSQIESQHLLEPTGGFGVVNKGVGFVAGLATDILKASPSLLGGPTALWKVGLPVVWGSDSAGETYNILDQMKGRDGQPIPENIKQATALGVGGIVAGIGAIGGPVQGTAARTAMAAFSKDFIKQAMQRPTLQAALGNIVKSSVKGTVPGIAMMGGMTLAQQIGMEAAKQASPGDWDTIANDPRIREQYANQMVDTVENAIFAIGGAHVLGGMAEEYGHYKQSQASIQTFNSILDQSADSKMRERSPDAFRTFMQSQVGDTGAENVYVPAAKIQEMYQKSGVTPGADDGIFGKAVPDIDQQLKQAGPISGDVVIPTADYAAHIAGTPMDAALKDDIRLRPDGMSMSEQREFEQKYQDILSQMGEHLKQQQDSTEPQRHIFEDMQAKAQAAGYTPAQASQYAAITASRYLARGERLGIDARELYHQQGIEVRRGTPGELPEQALTAFPAKQVGNAVTLDDMEKQHRARVTGTNAPVASVLEHLKQGGPKDKKPLTLTQWLKKKGGIKEEGGEMAALDANKQLKGLVTKKGMSHDDAALSAWEAGYIGKAGGERPSINELRDAIAKDLREKNVVSQHEAPADQGAGAQADELAKILNEHEIPYKERETADILHDMEAKGIIGAREFNQGAVEINAKMAELEKQLNSAKPEERAAIQKKMDDLAAQAKAKPESGMYADLRKKVDAMRPEYRAQRLESLNKKIDAGIATPKEMAEREMLAEPTTLRQDHRAKVTMAEGQHIISLFEKNDKTSILHELGHIWLDELQADAMREDAPEQLKKDWQTVKEYIGHGEGIIQKDSHETFARSFEQYLMEGKAPSNALVGAFRRFKQWFTNIYRTVQNLHVNLNDDVRQVFDRMLATDDEIAQTEARQSANQLFKTKEDGGMTDAEFKAYNEKASNVQQAAREQLLTEALADIRKKNTAEWNKAEKDIRPAITEAVKNRQDIRALEWFRTGKLRDAEGNERDVPAMEIQRSALPDGAEKDLPKGITVSTEGEHPDDIAPLLGYANGDDLINDLRDLGKTEQSIGRKNLQKFVTDKEVDAQLQQHFGVSDDELKQKAEALVDGADRLDMKLAELRALARKDGQAVTFTKENIGRWADDHIAGMKATDGANVFQFVRAAAKAGREATRAVEAGKDAEAVQALQKQALNMALAERARVVEKDYNSGMKLMKRVAGEQTIKSTEQSYLNQVHALLQQLGMKVNRDSKELQNSLAGKTLSDFVIDKVSIGRDIAVADDMMAKVPSLASLTVDQFRDLKDMVKSLLHNGREEQSIIVDGKRVEKDRIITDVLKNIATFKERPKAEFMNPADAGFLDRSLNKFTSAMRAADSELLRPEQFLDWLDKRNILGPLNTHVFRPLKEAQVMENDLLAEQSKLFHDMDQGADWHKSLKDEIPNTTLIDPDTKRPARMSRKTMLTVALNTGNESNFKRLAEGYGWERDSIHDFLQKNMTKADWDFTQYAWDSFEKLWPKIEAMQRRTSGVAPPKIEATPITTPHGEYRGGYYPVVYDPNKTQKGGSYGEGIFDNDYYRPTTAKGHTIARVQDYSDRILLNLDVLPWKLRQAIHDLAFREAIVNADKILSDQRFTEALKATWGPEYGKEFRPWLKDIANAPNADNRPMSFIDNALRYSRMTMVEMGIGFRLTTMLKHGSTALSNSVGELGPDAMRRGVQEYYSDRDAKKEMVFAKSGELRHRMTQYDRDIRENMASLMGEDSTLQNMRRFGHYGVAFLDLESAVPTWIGAYRKNLADGMEEKDAIFAADKTVRNAHGAQGQVDLAGIQRGPEYKKLFTMFYGFFNHMYNRERDLVHRVANDEKIDMSMVMARTLTYIAIPAMIEQAVSGHHDKDEGWGHWAARSIMNQMAATIPFVRDLAGYLEAGRSQETPMSRSIKAIGNQVKDIKNATTGDKVSGKWLKHAIETPGYVFGAPTGQAATSAQFLWDVNNGKEDPQAVADWIHGIIYGTAKAK